MTRLRRGVSRLVSAARHLLRADGRQMVLKVDRKEPGREILRWRFVSLALPPGILVAAASIPGRMPPERVRILHSSIAPDYPVAHQHVHHAAMMSFEELWVTLRRRALVQPSELQSSLRSERAFCPGLHRGACPGGRSAKEPENAKMRPLARESAHVGVGWSVAASLHRRSSAGLSRGTCQSAFVLPARALQDGKAVVEGVHRRTNEKLSWQQLPVSMGPKICSERSGIAGR